MNSYYRKILTGRIRKALQDAETAANINHPSLIGKLREIVLTELIAPLLNTRYAIGYGKITDYKGSHSGEIDLCIYSTTVHPPILFSTKNDIGVFPIESVLACVEVKSKFTSNGLKTAYQRFATIEKKLIITSGVHDENNHPMAHVYQKHKYAFFAFSAESDSYTPNTILDVYKRIDPNWDKNPLIQSICLAGRGWLCFTSYGWIHMSYDRKNKVNEEIIGFLCTLIHDLPKVEVGRGVPRIGYYLTDTSNSMKFEAGKLIKRPWRKGSRAISFESRNIE